MTAQPPLDLITLGEGLVQFGARTRGPSPGEDLRRSRRRQRAERRDRRGTAGSSGGMDQPAGNRRLRRSAALRRPRRGWRPVRSSATQPIRPESSWSSVATRSTATPRRSTTARAPRAHASRSRSSTSTTCAAPGIFHTTGISLAVSGELAEAAAAAGATAADAGARRSFDVNYRAKLWSADEARPGVEAALANSDIAFCSLEDARALWGVDDADEALELVASFGPG